MATLVLFLFRFARLLFSGLAALAVENAALRIQLDAFRTEATGFDFLRPAGWAAAAGFPECGRRCVPSDEEGGQDGTAGGRYLIEISAGDFENTESRGWGKKVGYTNRGGSDRATSGEVEIGSS